MYPRPSCRLLDETNSQNTPVGGLAHPDLHQGGEEDEARPAHARERMGRSWPVGSTDAHARHR